MNAESLKKIKQLTECNIEELGKKSNISDTDVKCAIAGFELIDWINSNIGSGEEMRENGYSQHSGFMEPMANPRRYNITSYNAPRGMSFDRGMSRTYQGNGRGYSSNGNSYSRHSIGDRVISCMEQMMDEAASDYERQELHRFMEMIRSAE